MTHKWVVNGKKVFKTQPEFVGFHQKFFSNSWCEGQFLLTQKQKQIIYNKKKNICISSQTVLILSKFFSAPSVFINWVLVRGLVEISAVCSLRSSMVLEVLGKIYGCLVYFFFLKKLTHFCFWLLCIIYFKLQFVPDMLHYIYVCM